MQTHDVHAMSHTLVLGVQQAVYPMAPTAHLHSSLRIFTAVSVTVVFHHDERRTGPRSAADCTSLLPLTPSNHLLYMDVRASTRTRVDSSRYSCGHSHLDDTHVQPRWQSNAQLSRGGSPSYCHMSIACTVVISVFFHERRRSRRRVRHPL